jgi:hypothetical protein
MIVDITDKVKFGDNDGECLPLEQCICGYKFNRWSFIISVYEDISSICPNCGKSLFFRTSISVYEITKE